MNDQAEGLRQAMREAGVSVQEYRAKPDKAKLWDELKSEIEAYISHGSVTDTTDVDRRMKIERNVSIAQYQLDRMIQMETLAMIRPATPETFARVAEDMKRREEQS